MSLSYTCCCTFEDVRILDIGASGLAFFGGCLMILDDDDDDCGFGFGGLLVRLFFVENCRDCRSKRVLIDEVLVVVSGFMA